MRDDDLLDRAIADTARSLSEGTPGRGVRETVAERIAAGRSPMIWRLAYLGAAVVIIAAAMLWRPAPADIGEVAVMPDPIGVSPALPAGRPAVPGARDVPSPAVTQVQEAQGARQVQAALVTAPTAAIEPIVIESLDTYELPFDPMSTPMMITVDAIDIRPIDVEP